MEIYRFVVLSLFQHLQELLNLDISALEYMMNSFPDIKEKEEMRKIIGRFGLTGRQQVSFLFLFRIHNSISVCGGEVYASSIVL